MTPAAETRPLPLAERIGTREFPSAFQAWNPADNLDEPPDATLARHDLVFHAPGFFGLEWEGESFGLATAFKPASVARALERRRAILARNPRTVLIAEIRYRDAWTGFLPDDHAWWKRDAGGGRVPGWAEGGFFIMDFQNPEYRAHVAARARAAVESGVLDGVMLDWWQDDDDRVELAKAVRRAVGEDAIIMVNANDRRTPRTAPYVNGCFMECYRSATPEDWARIAETLRWAEANLREPRVNCLESWYHESRRDLNLMRAVTTLSLTQSDGYCLFSDPNDLPTPDHLHDWYPFWEKSLGRPRGAGARQADGSWRREFERGTAVHNPAGNARVAMAFESPRTSLATGRVAREHAVAPCDGDIFVAGGKAVRSAAP